MDGALVGSCRTLALGAEPFAPARTAGWEHARLACDCGGESFRLIGWPRAAVGGGGALFRAFARVLREARAAMEPPERAVSPWCLPLSAGCERCGRETLLFDDERIPGRLPPDLRRLPRESLRCRVCRRGVFGIAVAIAEGELPRDAAAVDVHARCEACHRTARVAWSEPGASEQARRLDRLYGRR